jgi:hypothetical protein
MVVLPDYINFYFASTQSTHLVDALQCRPKNTDFILFLLRFSEMVYNEHGRNGKESFYAKQT